MATFMHLSWIPLGLLAAFFWSWVFIINHSIKAPGIALLFWRGLVPVIIFTPFALILGMPSHPMFYILMVALAVVTSITDVLLQGAVGKFGGATVSRLVPLNVGVLFIAYFFARPGLFADYVQTPIPLAGVILGLIGSVYYATQLRHNAVTRSAAIYLMPALATGTLTFILGKLLFDYAPLEQVIYAYMLVQGLVVVPTSLVAGKALGHNIRKEIFNKRSLIAGCLFGLASSVYTIPYNMAMESVPHPAYLNALLLTQALFVYLFFKLRGEKASTDATSGFLMLISIACMLIFSTFL